MESDSIRDRFERRRIFPANSSTRKRREAEGSDPVCVFVHRFRLIGGSVDRIPERVDNAAAKDISGFSHICFTQPPRSVRERETVPRGFSVIDIGKQVGRSSVDRNRIKRWRGGRRRSSGAVVENSGRRVYYLSFLTRPGNGEETKVTRTRMETEAKRRNNETLPRLYGEFNFIRRLTATTRTFRREFRLSSPPAVNIFIAVVISPTNDSRDWNTSFD